MFVKIGNVIILNTKFAYDKYLRTRDKFVCTPNYPQIINLLSTEHFFNESNYNNV